MRVSNNINQALYVTGISGLLSQGKPRLQKDLFGSQRKHRKTNGQLPKPRTTIGLEMGAQPA